MAQPQKYERVHDFTGDEQDAIDRGSINNELDSAALTINQIRRNLAALQNDDLSLAPGVVGISSLSDDAADALTKSVDKKSEAATEAARRAEKAALEAIDSADQAATSAANAATSEANARGVVESSINLIKAEGDTQIDRVKAVGDDEIFKKGVTCREEKWTLSSAATSGSTLTLPNGLSYIVGRHHLRLSWNNLVLYPGRQFEEVGTTDTTSTTVKILMAMKSGDELDAWVGALGKIDLSDLSGYARTEDLASVATSGSYADLSNKPEIPVVPSALKNPFALTFSGAVTATYDGSGAVTVDIPEGGGETPDLTPYAKKTDLAAVATSGAYSDLEGTPDLSPYAKKTDIPSQLDLTPYVKSESLATVATSGAYSDLTGTPTVPSKTSQLTNDSGFLTSHQSLNNYYTKAQVDSAISNAIAAITDGDSRSY